MNITNPTDISKKINRSLNEGEKIFNLNTKIKTTASTHTSKGGKKKKHVSFKRKKSKK